MKKFLLLLLLTAACGMRAQTISHVEQTRSWYYVYDQQGKKLATISTSAGDYKGCCGSFFILQTRSWVYLYDARGRKYKTLSLSEVGEILSVSGDTFTSRKGAWIYTWNREGRKVATRAAR